MYKLHAPLIKSTDENIQVVKKLFKEILGYDEEEISQFADTGFSCTVATNLSLEQVKLILQPFFDCSINVYLTDRNEKIISYRDAGIYLTRNQPKEHYYDKPVISREHLVDPYTQLEKEIQYNIQQNRIEQNTKPIITCPYCNSANTRKLPKKSLFISHSLFFGSNLNEVGKNFHCNKCGADF